MTNIVTLPSIVDGEDKSSMLGNRIRKNYRHIRKWAKRTSTNCFRVYDREIHEYPFAIDFYDGRFCVHYYSKSSDNDNAPFEIVDEVETVLTNIFGIPRNYIYWRTRSKTKETRQYEKQAGTKDFFTVIEYGVKFKVNLVDYLDTGLFLDHRETRKVVAADCKRKKLLNLFAYTCSFSVHAAIAGAIFTKSVDMSNTYTAWGRDNFDLNGLAFGINEIVREDCLKFLDSEIKSSQKYDVVVIDPPTISRSKKMDDIFDIQLDYINILKKCLKLLSTGGVIYFSTNSRRFIFDESLFTECKIVDITTKTLPLDFHNKKIHRCWKISLE